MGTQAESGFVAAERGDFSQDPGSDASSGWKLTRQLQRWFALEDGPPPIAARLADLDADDPGRSIAWALTARAAWLAMDEPLFDDLDRLGSASAPDDPFARLARGYRRSAAGESAFAETLAEVSALGRARGELGASCVIETTALGALDRLLVGDYAEATALSRRASRMAAAEGLPQAIYLANLVLARVRRFTGRPHHATRIVAGLATIATSPWQPRLLWEELSSGTLERPADPTRHGPAVWFRALAHAAVAGDRARMSEAAGALETAALTLDAKTDARLARFAIDAMSDPPHVIEGWCFGRTTELPGAIRGLAAHTGGVDPMQATAAYVVAGPDRTARRVVGLGVALERDAVRLDPSRRRAGRTETLISELALLGEAGADHDALFKLVYRFDYEAAAHANVFRVLLHRSRTRIEGVAEIIGDGDRFRLEPQRSFVVPDPRCENSVSDLLLRIVASRRGCLARDVAKALGLPISTVQKSLREMASDGVIRAEAAGAKKIEYHVDDTTFAEPTRA